MRGQESKQANDLLNLYLSLHEERYKVRPTMNRFKSKWGMLDVLTDLGYDHAVETLKFYYKNDYTTHTLMGFFKSYDELYKSLMDQRAEQERKRLLMERTHQRVKEWNVSRGQTD